MSQIAASLQKAIKAGVPIVSATTSDPWGTIQDVCAALPKETTKVEWDFVRGFSGRNQHGVDWVASLGEERTAVNAPLTAFIVAADLPQDAILFIHLADKWLKCPMALQAVWNLRDVLKLGHRLLVLLSKSGDFPGELADDVMPFDEPLPTGDELAAIVEKLHQAAGVKLDKCAGGALEKAIEALRGLSAFAAEQITALSLRRKGLDVDALWERKRQQIEQTPGLKVYRGGDTFEAIGGCDVVKGFLRRIVAGQARPNAVVFIDEIEKAMGGAKGDMSGVTQDQLGSLLSYMQDNSAAGMIFIGPPGAAKSAIAKAAGAEAGIPTIQLDLGAAKGSLVGQSEQQLRTALKVITAVSNGRSLWIATCNSIAELPPELRRRFTLGTYFFDLPSQKERDAIWKIWTTRYELGPDKWGDDGFSDEGWTGAEIKQCVDIAWRLGCSLGEAAEFVVPVSRSAAEVIRRLREQAAGKFLSASYPGVFELDREKPAAKSKGRSMKVED